MSTRHWLLACCSLCSSGCQVADNYEDPSGPRYEGDYSGGASASRLPELRVVTFNIQFGERHDLAAEELATDPNLSGVDILLLQEMDAPSTDAIARALGMSYVYYPGSRHQTGRDFGNAILARWPLVSDKKLILPHKSPTDGRIRIAVQATVATPLGHLAAYSLHTETPWLGPRARLEQAGAVLAEARASGLPSLAGGDFNTGDPGSVEDTVDLFRSEGFTWASSGAGNTSGGYALDHIFVHDLSVLRSGSVATEASDHRPSWSQVSFESPR